MRDYSYDRRRKPFLADMRMKYGVPMPPPGGISPDLQERTEEAARKEKLKEAGSYGWFVQFGPCPGAKIYKAGSWDAVEGLLDQERVATSALVTVYTPSGKIQRNGIELVRDASGEWKVAGED